MRRGAWIVAVLVALAGVVALVVSTRPGASRRTTFEADPGGEPTHAGRWSRGPTRTDALPARTADLPAPETPIVDAVKVEKTTACEAEELLVTVQAHTPGGHDDPYLHGSIGDRRGLTVPIVVRRGPDGRMTRTRVVVHGRGDAATVVDVPEVTILDCPVEYHVRIASRERVNAPDEFDFTATVARGAYAAPFEPVALHWDFGDGTKEQAGNGMVTHSYANRPQERMYSDFVIAVEAVDESGRVARGRMTLALRNDAFDRLVRDREVQLQATLLPRFAAVGEDGVARQRVRLWHHHAHAVTLERVVIRTDYRGELPQQVRESRPAEVLGIGAVAPEGSWIDLAIDAAEASAVTRREYLLEGTAADGLRAAGRFSILLVPSPDPPLEEDIGPPPTLEEEPPPPPPPREGREPPTAKGGDP